MLKQAHIIDMSICFDGFVVNSWSGGYKIVISWLFNILYLTRTDFWGLADDSLADVVAIKDYMNVVTNR